MTFTKPSDNSAPYYPRTVWRKNPLAGWGNLQRSVDNKKWVTAANILLAKSASEMTHDADTTHAVDESWHEMVVGTFDAIDGSHYMVSAETTLKTSSDLVNIDGNNAHWECQMAVGTAAEPDNWQATDISADFESTFDVQLMHVYQHHIEPFFVGHFPAYPAISDTSWHKYHPPGDPDVPTVAGRTYNIHVQSSWTADPGTAPLRFQVALHTSPWQEFKIPAPGPIDVHVTHTAKVSDSVDSALIQYSFDQVRNNMVLGKTTWSISSSPEQVQVKFRWRIVDLAGQAAGKYGTMAKELEVQVAEVT